MITNPRHPTISVISGMAEGQFANVLVLGSERRFTDNSTNFRRERMEKPMAALAVDFLVH
jgi:hypothetical protein